MNQKSLIIAIVAVVAVVVLVTLWLTGAAGSGPLSGCADCVVAPQPTALTLDVWVYTGNQSEREIVFQGGLTAGTYPVTGRTITIRTGGSTVATVTTRDPGRYDVIYNESGGSHPYVAVFAGDDEFFSSESNTVSSP